MSKRNFAVSIMGRIVTMITSFLSRTVFVRSLGAEYLGLGGFFGNIFSVISLCELGLGAAIAQSLYKPLADEDEYKVAAIMSFYGRVCKIVASVSLLLSLFALFVVPSLVKTQLNANVIIPAYLLFVIHITVSYILTPKCTLVVCDQRMYVVTAIRSAFSVLALFLQCAVLVLTQNYLFYLATRILVLTLEDILINRYADKKYPCLSLRIPVSKEYKQGLFSNVKAIMWHKIGGVLSRSTDSILLTYFVGLAGMGKYSNYALIIGTVGAFFDVAVNAVSASVGNLGAENRGAKSELVMRKLYFMNFWLLTVGSSVIVSTLNPFIGLWLGEEMLFSNVEMMVIVTSFYFSCIRDPVQIFVSSFGLFKESRYIPVLRALFNLVLSLLFVNVMGVSGVFLGTAMSTVLVPLCGEVAVLYKHGFSMKASNFYREMFGYIAVSALSACACFAMTYGIAETVGGLIARAVSSFCISNVLLLVMSSGKPYFFEMKNLVYHILTKRRSLKF